MLWRNVCAVYRKSRCRRSHGGGGWGPTIAQHGVVVTGSWRYTAFLMQKRGGSEHWTLNIEYPGSHWTDRFRRHLELVLSINGGVDVRVVKIGERSGSQALLENGRMLVRTNIYFCIAHLFCLNVWPIDVVLNMLDWCHHRNVPTHRSNSSLVDPIKFFTISANNKSLCITHISKLHAIYLEVVGPLEIMRFMQVTRCLH